METTHPIGNATTLQATQIGLINVGRNNPSGPIVTASAMYTIEQVRDKEWVKWNGHMPTLMDYSRFNYVAQPEDKIDVADLIPGIGPYDLWATAWGYYSASIGSSQRTSPMFPRR